MQMLNPLLWKFRLSNPLLWNLRVPSIPSCKVSNLACVTNVKQLAFCALVVFSFVPIMIYINLSQGLLFVICAFVLCSFFLKMPIQIAVSIFLILCIAASQMIGIYHFLGVNKTYLTPSLFVISLTISPTIQVLAKQISRERITCLVPRIVNLLLAFFAAECISRFIFSPYMKLAADADTADSFYRYKSSLFFVDSNFVGIALLCLLAIMFSYRDLVAKNKFMLAYLLLFMSISRASIGAGICQFVIYKFWRWRRPMSLALITAQAIIIWRVFFSFTGTGAESVRSLDGSFASKFYILMLMSENWIHSDNISRLCGIGAGNARSIFDIFAHNIIVTLVTELGVIGSTLLIAYVYHICKKKPVAIYLLVFPIVINGFSLVSTSMVYFFAALGLLCALDESKRDDCFFLAQKR